MTIYNIKDVRQALKNKGFKIKVKTYSSFKHVSVYHDDGQKMPSIFTKETLEKFSPALDVINKLKSDNNKIVDGQYPVTIN